MSSANDPYLTFADRESARFGMRIFRGSLQHLDVQSLRDALRSAQADVAIIRVPARELLSLAELGSNGTQVILADTLVHYAVDLPAVAEPSSQHAVRLKPVESAAEILELQQTVKRTFGDYVSHYHMNPLFSRPAIVEGYAEWATRHASPPRSDAVAWLVTEHGRTVGFSCASFDVTNGVACGSLNGILPGERGRGMYRAMLKETLLHFQARNAARFVIATQAHNVTVQRAWQDEGFRLESVEYTIHLNTERARDRRA